jgi:hypothetical protein
MTNPAFGESVVGRVAPRGESRATSGDVAYNTP